MNENKVQTLTVEQLGNIAGILHTIAADLAGDDFVKLHEAGDVLDRIAKEAGEA